MATNHRTALLVKLEALRRGVDLILRTRDRGNRREMLSALLRDLRPFERLELDLLDPREATLLKELYEAAKELRGNLGRAKASKPAASPRKKRETPTNGTPSRRTASTLRAAGGDESREPGHRHASASGVPGVRKQDPRGDQSPNSRRGPRKRAGQGDRQVPPADALSRQAGPREPSSRGGVEDLLSITRPLTRTEWRQLGFYAYAAKFLEASQLTLSDLKKMTRRDLLGIQGIGPKALKVCERLLGRPLPVEQPADGVKYWLARGLQHRAGRALVRAGISSIADLGGKSREELQALWGVGATVLARLEELLGRQLPFRSHYWMDLGLTPVLSRRLVHAGIYSVSDFSALTREGFLAIAGMSESALELCQKATGRTLRSPLNYWLDLGLSKKLSHRLMKNRITDMQMLRDLGYLGLRRLGYSFYEIEALHLKLNIN